MLKILLSVFIVIVTAVAVLAHDDGDTHDDDDKVDVSEAVVPENPTYYEHVKPILELHCVACHSEGQIAGDIPLTTFEDAESGELRRPHHIDLKTGTYRGRQVLEPKEDF